MSEGYELIWSTEKRRYTKQSLQIPAEILYGSPETVRTRAFVAAFATVYGLTETEACILNLAVHHSLRHLKIARLREVSFSTLRKQIRHMLRKTGAGSLAELVIMVLTEAVRVQSS